MVYDFISENQNEMSANWNKCFANVYFKILECMSSYSTNQCKNNYEYVFRSLENFATSGDSRNYYCPNFRDY